VEKGNADLRKRKLFPPVVFDTPDEKFGNDYHRAVEESSESSSSKRAAQATKTFQLSKTGTV